MKVDDLKRLQATIGVAIETCESMKLAAISGILANCMRMSAEYEQLIRTTQHFVDKAGEAGHLEKSELW